MTPAAKSEPKPVETARKPLNQFLAGLTQREIQSIKYEAWRTYGMHWKGVSTRSRYVRQPMLETLAKYGYPRDLQMIPVVESSYDPYAQSSVGAAGLWQLMPVTAHDLGIKSSKHFDGRRDIRSSTKGAARFLTKQYKRFGNWPMALAAYHLGPTAVQRRLNRRPWQPEKGLKKLPLPPITKTYIRHILGLIALHEEGRLAFPKPYPVTTVSLQTPIDLAALQEASKLPKNQIFKFNPELGLKQYYDGKHDSLSLRISQKRLKAVKQNLPVKPSEYMSITIAHNESLQDISQRYKTSLYQLKRDNPGLSIIAKTGQKLRIPVKIIKRVEAEKNPLVQPEPRLVARN